MSFRYTLDSIIFEIYENRMDDNVFEASFKFVCTIVHISNSIELTNFILGKNIQQHRVHQMLKSESDLDRR